MGREYYFSLERFSQTDWHQISQHLIPPSLPNVQSNSHGIYLLMVAVNFERSLQKILITMDPRALRT